MYEEQLIIAGNNQASLYKAGGNTTDIVNAIAEADKVSLEYVTNFAHTLQGADVAETCANIWHWVRNTIPYVEDKTGVQHIQLPGQLYNNRYTHLGGTGKGGDCKSMSLMCSSILRALGNYDFVYRFISEDRAENVHHVYLIVADKEENGDACYIPLDCTLTDFGVEVNYAKKIDRKPAHPVNETAGIGSFFNAKLVPEDLYIKYQQQYPALNKPYSEYVALFNKAKSFAFITQFDERYVSLVEHYRSYTSPDLHGQDVYVAESVWEQQTEDLKKNFGAYWEELTNTGRKNYGSVAQDFIDKYGKHGQPIKFSESIKQLREHREDLLAYGSTLIYHFWPSSNFINHTACRGEGATYFPPVPFPADMSEKKQTGDALYEALRNWGWSDANIMQLCNLGTFRKYGIGLDYMLYRCKCLQLYGQPFAPRIGVPYLENGTEWKLRGGDLSTTWVSNKILQISMCMPLLGGIGRPFGEPYWSAGGHVINNGASDATIKEWVKTNPKPPYGQNISFDTQMVCLEVYNAWMKGNIVMLDQPKPVTDRPGATVALRGGNYPAVYGQHAIGAEPITLGVTAIVTIVVACVTAVIAIGTFIAKMVEMFKPKPNNKNIAIPISDFKWDYQTSDGCLIGHCTNPNGCGGAVTAKMCNGKIVELNPNPNDPTNQAPDPGNLFGGDLGGNKKKLLIGGGIALAAGGMLMLND